MDQTIQSRRQSRAPLMLARAAGLGNNPLAKIAWGNAAPDDRAAVQPIAWNLCADYPDIVAGPVLSAADP